MKTSEEVKKLLFADFKKQRNNFDFKSAFKVSFSAQRGGFVLKFDHGAELWASLQIYSDSYPDASFGVSTAIALRGGKVADNIRQTLAGLECLRLLKTNLMAAQSWYWVPRFSEKPNNAHYVFEESTDIEQLSDAIFCDFFEFMCPLAKAFVEDFTDAVDLFLADEKICRKLVLNPPFLCMLSLMDLSGRGSEIPSAVSLAKKNEGFFDFHKSSDVEVAVENFLQKA